MVRCVKIFNGFLSVAPLKKVLGKFLFTLIVCAVGEDAFFLIHECKECQTAQPNQISSKMNIDCGDKSHSCRVNVLEGRQQTKFKTALKNPEYPKNKQEVQPLDLKH